MSVNIVAVTKDEPVTYEAFQVEDNAESLHQALTWLAPRSESQEGGFKNSLYESARNLVGHWLVKSSDSIMSAVVLETDFAADWTVVESDPLAQLEQEFAVPELSEDMKDRGEFQTEEQWQCYEVYANDPKGARWWDAEDETDALERSKAAGFPGKVRVRTQTVVTGPWRTA